MSIYEKYFVENNPIAYKVIINAFQNSKLSHAYLFCAPKEYFIEKEPMFLIQKLISKSSLRNPLTFPDLLILDGSLETITKEKVINVVDKLNQTALDSLGIKVLFIKNIENGNLHSLSSLLKFIEEPTNNTFIIMSTNNISHVLPTIKSRSQIINLKSLSKNFVISSLIDFKIPKLDAKILASVSSTIEIAQKHNNEDFFNLINNLIKVLSEIILQKDKIYLEFSQLIKKENCKMLLFLLVEFVNDIWKYEELMELTFEKEKILIKKYVDKKFDYNKALYLINDFISKQNANLNFELQKNKFLIELEKCYV